MRLSAGQFARTEIRGWFQTRLKPGHFDVEPLTETGRDAFLVPVRRERSCGSQAVPPLLFQALRLEAGRPAGDVVGLGALS